MKIPQLRLIVTDFCDSKCIYCRPTGEAVCQCADNHCMSLETAIAVSKMYLNHGGKDIKITGGDPVYWNHLVDCVRILKNELKVEKVEVITRSTKIKYLIDDLIDAGLDSINFSLDTLSPEKYNKITGKNDLPELLEIIKDCSSKLHCKINTVVMNGINNNEICNLILFCRENKVDEIKLLDIITDLHKGTKNNSNRLSEVFSTTLPELYTGFTPEVSDLFKKNPETVFQGGLGHPLKVYKYGDVDVIVKDANNGAWYGECCEKCDLYPCHDALMALRALPNNKLQVCLLNENNLYDLNDSPEDNEKQFSRCLKIYQNAKFRG